MKKQKLKTKYCSVKKISTVDIYQMRSIYSQYYRATKWSIFLNDLSKKDGAFIIRRADDNQIVGFSTIVNYRMTLHGKKVIGVFSGDTIIDRRYWGSRSLQIAFYRYVLKQKCLHPTKPIYWLLISKGFKTYLLLANNFYTFYPNPDNKHPELATAVDSYCNKLFPEYYDANQKILDFGDHYQSLKDGVAEIDDKMLQNHPNIAFFQQCNPRWRDGTELPCIGVIDWSTLAKYVFQYLQKPISKGHLDSQRAKASTNTDRSPTPLQPKTSSAKVYPANDRHSA